MMKNLYLYMGLFVFYFIVFFSPNKPIYFSAYIISTFFFYLGSKNIRLSLLYSLILSLFSNIGIASSLFLLEPLELNQGAGWQFSPQTMLALCLLPLSIGAIFKKIHFADWMPVLLTITSFITLIIFPYSNVLYGIVSLTEIMLIYFLMRIYIARENLGNVSYLLISMLIFQILVGLIQFVLKHPIGILTDTDLSSGLFGYTASEEENLYRISGTFLHPNYFASFLLITTPFILLKKNNNLILKIVTILSLITLFFTYSRAAWIIFAFIILLMHAKSLKAFMVSARLNRKLLLSVLTCVFLLVLLFPYIITRGNTFFQAFEEKGSFGTRWKLYQEAGNIITQYPLTGVGLNRSLEEYVQSPITDLFTYTRPSNFFRIHNLFLEIAAEIGIPGLLFFVWFLFLVLKKYFTEKLIYPKNAAFYGLLGLIGISMLNPFFHTSQFYLFYLLSAIILA